MAQAFNINARLSLQGPYNVQPVVQSIRRQVEGIPANLDFKLSPKSAQAIGGISREVVATTEQLRGMTRIAGNLGEAIGKIKFNSDTNVGTAEFRKQVKAAVADLKKLDDAISGVKSQSALAGEVFGSTARRLALFVVAAKVFQTISSGFETAVGKALAFQNEMVRLGQIGGTSASAVAAVSAEVTRLATSLGTSSQDLSEASVTLRQAGLSAGETKTALEALAKTTLAPTFESLKNTTEGVIAMRQQFDVASEDIAKRLGSINTVAGEFAVESEDLVTVIRKAGGAFKSASGDMVTSEQSFNQLLALFTSVRNTTRESADEIATGLRTIFARVQSTSVSNALKQMGVDLRFTREESKEFGRDVTGQFVGAYEAVRRLSAATQDIPTTDPRFSQIVEQLGGFRQISRVIPLLQQFGTAQKAYTVAQAGANSLTTDAAKAQDSFLVKLTKVKEEFFDLVRVLSGNKTFQTMIDYFLKGTSAALSLAKALEPIVPLITTIAAVKIAGSIKDFVPRAFTKFQDFGGAASNISRRERIDPATLRRRGGGVIPGHGTGDKVPLLAEPGEFVLNRKASQSIGYAALHRWNGGSYDRKETPGFAAGGPTRFPIITEPGEFYFDRKAVNRIGMGKLEAANRTGRLPEGVAGTPAVPKRFATGGPIKPGDAPSPDRSYPHSIPLLRPLDPRERLALKLKAMGRLGDAYKDRPRTAYAVGGETGRTMSNRVLDWDRIRKLRDLEQGKNGEAPMKVDGFSRLRRRFEVDPDTKMPTARSKYYATSRSARYALGRGFDIPPQIKKLIGRKDGGDTDEAQKKLLDLQKLLGEHYEPLTSRVKDGKFENAREGGAQKVARQLDDAIRNALAHNDIFAGVYNDLQGRSDTAQVGNLSRETLGGNHAGGRMGEDETGELNRSFTPDVFTQAGASPVEAAIRRKMYDRAKDLRLKQLPKADRTVKSPEGDDIPVQSGDVMSKALFGENVTFAEPGKAEAARRGIESPSVNSPDIVEKLEEIEAKNRAIELKLNPPTSKIVADKPPADPIDFENYQPEAPIRAIGSKGLSLRMGRVGRSADDVKAKPQTDAPRLDDFDSLVDKSLNAKIEKEIRQTLEGDKDARPGLSAKSLQALPPPAEQELARRGYHYGPNNPTIPEIPDHLKAVSTHSPLNLSEDVPTIPAATIARQDSANHNPVIDIKKVKTPKSLVTQATDTAPIRRREPEPAATASQPAFAVGQRVSYKDPIGSNSATGTIKEVQGSGAIVDFDKPRHANNPKLQGLIDKSDLNPISSVATAPVNKVSTPSLKEDRSPPFDPERLGAGSTSVPINTGGRGPRLPRKTASGSGEVPGGGPPNNNEPPWIRKLIASITSLDKTITTSIKQNRISPDEKPIRARRTRKSANPVDVGASFTSSTITGQVDPSQAQSFATHRTDAEALHNALPLADDADADRIYGGSRPDQFSLHTDPHIPIPLAARNLGAQSTIPHPNIITRPIPAGTDFKTPAFDFAGPPSPPPAPIPPYGYQTIENDHVPGSNFNGVSERPKPPGEHDPRFIGPRRQFADLHLGTDASSTVPDAGRRRKLIDTGRAFSPPDATGEHPIRAGFTREERPGVHIPITPGSVGAPDPGFAPNGRRLINTGRLLFRTPLDPDEVPSRRPIPLSEFAGHPTMTENDLFEPHDGLAAPVPRGQPPKRENEPRYQRLREFYAGQVATSGRDRPPERQAALTDRLADRGFRNATDVQNGQTSTPHPRFKRDYTKTILDNARGTIRFGGRLASAASDVLPPEFKALVGDVGKAIKQLASSSKDSLFRGVGGTVQSTKARFTIDPEIVRDVKTFANRAVATTRSGVATVSQFGGRVATTIGNASSAVGQRSSDASQAVKKLYSGAAKELGTASSRAIDSARKRVESYTNWIRGEIKAINQAGKEFVDNFKTKYADEVASLGNTLGIPSPPNLGQIARGAIAPIQRGFQAVSGVVGEVPGAVSSRVGPSSDIGKVVGRTTRTVVDAVGSRFGANSSLGRKVGGFVNRAANLVGMGTTPEDRLKSFYDRFGLEVEPTQPRDTSKDVLNPLNYSRPLPVPSPSKAYRAGSAVGSLYRKSSSLIGNTAGFIRKAATAQRSFPFRKPAMSPDGVTPLTRGERFNKITNAGAAGVYGTTIAASYINDAYGNHDPNDVDSLQRSKPQQQFSGAVTGAALGAQVGAMTSIPGGLAIGAVIGAVVGFGTSLANVDKQIRQVRLDKALQGLARTIDDVTSGRVEAGSAAQAINKHVATVRETTSQTADTGGNLFNTFNDFLEKWTPVLPGTGLSLTSLGNTATRLGVSAASGAGSLVGLGFDHDSSTSVFGNSAADRAKAQFASQQSKEQELLGPMLPQLRQSMELLASSIKLNPKDFQTATGGDAGQRSRRADLLNQNGGRELIETISRVEKVPINQVVREFDATLVRANKSRSTAESVTATANDSDLQARRFERLGSALDAAALSLKKFQSAADAIESLAQGQVGTTAISGISEQAANLGGIDTDAVKNTTAFARTSLGGVGSGAIDQFAKTLEEIDKVKRDLPSLLTKAVKGSDFSEGNIHGDVSKAFDGFSPDIQKKLETKLHTIDPKTVAQDLTTNPEKFAQTLMEPFKEAESGGQNITKQLEAAPQKFAGDLGRHSLLQNQAGATSDRAAESGLGVVQAQTQLVNAATGRNHQVGLDDLLQPFNARQARLAGTAANPLDADSVASRLKTVQGKALEQGERANDVNASGGDRKQAQVEFTRLTNEAANLQKALEHLGDTSGRLSAIQTKIAESEKVRSSQLSLTERLLTGDRSSQVDFHRGAAGADVAAQQGNFAGFSPENIKLTLDALRAFGDIKFTQGPLKGFTGSGAAEKLVANSSALLPPQLGVDANATQRRVVGLHGEALGVQQEGQKATEALAKNQATLADKFFDKINKGFDKFFADAAKRLAQADVKDKQNDVDTATAGLEQKSSQLVTADRVTKDFGSLAQARELSASPDLKDLSQGHADLDRLAKIRKTGGVFTDVQQELDKSQTAFGVNLKPPASIQDRSDPQQREEFRRGEQQRLTQFGPSISAKSGLSAPEVDAAIVDYLGKLLGHVEPGGGADTGKKFYAGNEFLDSLKKSAKDSQGQALATTASKTESISRRVYGDSTLPNAARVRNAAAAPFELGEALKTVPQDVKSVDSARQAFDAQQAKLTASNLALIKATNQLTQAEKAAKEPEAVAIHKATGGSVFKPRGSDTVPAMLTPGEFVVKAGQARANREALHAINSGSGPVYKADGGDVFRTHDLRAQAGDVMANPPGVVSNLNRTADNLDYWKKIEQSGDAALKARTARNDADFKDLTAGRSFTPDAPTPRSKPIDLKRHVADYDQKHAETLADNQTAFDANVKQYDKDHADRVATSALALEKAKGLDATRVADNAKVPAPGVEPPRRVGPSDVTVARVTQDRVRRYTRSKNFVGPRRPVAAPADDFQPQVVRKPARRYNQDYTPRPLPVPASVQKQRSRRKYRPNSDYTMSDNQRAGDQIDAYIGSYLMGFAGGGMVPRGTDVVPAMLTKGEFVVDRPTASANLPLLQSLKPQYHAGGGSVGGDPGGGGGGAGVSGQVVQVLTSLPNRLLNAFSVLDKSVKPLASLSQTFAEFNDGQRDLSQSLSAWSTTAVALGQSLAPFSDSAAKLAKALANTSIPSVIQVQTKNQIEVLINGAQVLASIKGDLAEVVTQAVLAKLGGEVKRIITEMPAS